MSKTFAVTQPAVVITGGSRGIGRALAAAYAVRGKRVVIVGRDAGALGAAADEIAASGVERPITIALDLTVPDAAEVLLGATAQAGCHTDLLIINAGLGLSGTFVAQRAHDLHRLIALNVTSLTELTRAVLPEMLGRGRGHIVMMSSLGGVVPGPYQAVYYASKAYVLSLSEALSAECAGTGVNVSCVLPGPINTTFHARMGAERALYRRVLPQMSEQKLARLILRNVGLGRRVIAPGVLATLAHGALRLLPHAISVPVMAGLLKNSD